MEFSDAQIIDGVLAEFMPLCAIPHASRQEKAISDYLMKRLQDLGAAVERDSIYNIWASVPATKGRENEPIVALQAHMDMVCAAGVPDYDAKTSPIAAVRQDGWLSTNGRSSLGADCGAGVAMILWLLAQDFPHPPLRVIFTVREEIGLAGARDMAPECVAGVKSFINLDGFALKRILIGAAGGLREHYGRAITYASAPSGQAYRVTISGLTGGHSGFDIGSKRANAILCMGDFLRQMQTQIPFALVSLRGGEAFNAIPYQCEAVIVATAPIDGLIAEFGKELRRRHGHTDPNATIAAQPCDMPEKAWTTGVAASTLTLLGGFADGVYAMHPELPDTVSDSSNLGRIYVEDDTVCLDAMIRSMDVEAEKALHHSHEMTAGMCGFIGRILTQYPAWPAAPHSELATKMQELYRKYGEGEPEIIAQHVGLEPSYFQAMNPEMNSVCMGMEIHGCHSPEERWKLDSIPTLGRMLMEYLQ